jgi:hypothetical protein
VKPVLLERGEREADHRKLSPIEQREVRQKQEVLPEIELQRVVKTSSTIRKARKTAGRTTVHFGLRPAAL